MPWARVDDGWWCHPKVMGLDLAARGLWISAMSWSCAQRRDVVPAGFLGMVGAKQTEANALVDAGLWHEVSDGWRIHDWANYQDRSLSEKRADAGRKGGLKSRPSGSTPKQEGSTVEATPEAGPNPTRPVPSQPEAQLLPSQSEIATGHPQSVDERPVLGCVPGLMATDGGSGAVPVSEGFTVTAAVGGAR